MKRILITGAGGQIGTELAPALRRAYGEEAVLATDLREPPPGGPSALLDCLDADAFAAAVARHRADTVYHLAAMLSAKGEREPLLAYRVNMDCLVNALEVARAHGCALFFPSSIAAFGPDSPRDPTPQVAIQRPTSMYGITKVAGELLCDYYHRRWRVDVRGLRFPGLISHSHPPGGGTTDYAVEIFHAALAAGRYTCFLAADTQLDMMYMPDAVRAAIELMAADGAALRHRNAYNVTAMQVTPGRLAAAIREHLPEFELDYRIDPVRQAIADSWPRRLDDSAARADWGWRPEYDLAALTADMIERMSAASGRPRSAAPAVKG